MISTKENIQEPLDPVRIAALANAGERGGHGWQVEVSAEVESTNDAVREGLILPEGSRGRALFAESQTRGRGRRGASWLSGAPGESLLFSCALRPPLPVEAWPRLTHIAALALARTLQDQVALEVQVKWPNDIYWQGKKTAGILVETFFAPAASHPVAVIGVGINVNQQADAFPESLRSSATSLRAAAGRPLQRSLLAGHLLKTLAELVDDSPREFPAMLEALRGRALWLGERVRVEVSGRTLTGTHAGLGSAGELLLKLDEGPTLEIASAAGLRAESC